MNISIYDKIYDILNKFLNEESRFNPLVSKIELRQSDKFPLVVFTEDNNVYSLGTTRFEETYSKVYYQIDIYATDVVLSNKKISKVQVARELSELVDNVFSYNLRMRRLSCRPTPNLDNNIYRITIRYSANVNDRRNKLY